MFEGAREVELQSMSEHVKDELYESYLSGSLGKLLLRVQTGPRQEYCT